MGSETMAKTYSVEELAKAIKFNLAYCKMNLRRMGVDPASPIDEDTAAALAKRVSRPWPPQAA